MNQDTDNSVRRAALLIAVLSGFLIPFVSSSVNISLPTIGREFDCDAITLGWIRTAYLLTAVMFLLPFGRAADIHGRKRILRLGMSIYTAASALCAVSTSASFLIASRCLQGFGSSMVFGTAVAILTSVFPPGDRGKALGIRVAAVYIGLSSGPFLGGLLTQHLGWRFVFIINAALGLLVVGLLTWKLKGEWVGARGEKFDLTGSLICSGAILATVYGFTNLAYRNGPWLFGAGVLGIIVFVLFERKSPSPIVDIRLFTRNRVFAMSNLAAVINYCAVAANAFLLSLYLQEVMGLRPMWAGLVMFAQPAVQAIISPFAGKLSDRIEPRIVASSGMVLTAVGLGLLAFLSRGTPLGYVVGALVTMGLGFALFSAPNTNAIMSSVSQRNYSVAAAMQGTSNMMGMTLSMGIVMFLLSVHVGEAQIGPANEDAFLTAVRTSFGIFAGLCALGIFASLARGKLRPRAGASV